MSKTDHKVNNIRRSYTSLLVISLLGIFLGIYFAILTFINPTPKYDDLILDAVTVDKFEYKSKYRGGGNYYICTTDGNKFLLNGSFSAAELYDLLLPGTEISIKWYQHRNGTNYIEEINLEERTICTYTNDDIKYIIIGCIMGSIVIALGIGGLFFRYRCIKKELAALKK